MARLQHSSRAIESLPEITDIREVTRADLTHLQAPRPAGQIQSLKDSHHRLARAVASGMSNSQAAETCGMSYNRVSILKADPSFIELVAHYRTILTAEWKETADPVTDYMRSNALKAEQLISDRLDKAMEEDETIPLSQLVQVTSDRYDRLGYSKVTKSVNLNVDFAANLEAARRRSAPAREVKTIEASPTLQPQSAPVASTKPGGPPGSSPLRRFG
jgi:DNA-binding CsgD family transcriptional regulator